MANFKFYTNGLLSYSMLNIVSINQPQNQGGQKMMGQKILTLRKRS